MRREEGEGRVEFGQSGKGEGGKRRPPLILWLSSFWCGALRNAETKEETTWIPVADFSTTNKRRGGTTGISTNRVSLSLCRGFANVLSGKLSWLWLGSPFFFFVLDHSRSVKDEVRYIYIYIYIYSRRTAGRKIIAPPWLVISFKGSRFFANEDR